MPRAPDLARVFWRHPPVVPTACACTWLVFIWQQRALSSPCARLRTTYCSKGKPAFPLHAHAAWPKPSCCLRDTKVLAYEIVREFWDAT